jgi:Pregnancy-associated plasma protein-A/PKD domain/Secretion system C-terminal sorting domain
MRQYIKYLIDFRYAFFTAAIWIACLATVHNLQARDWRCANEMIEPILLQDPQYKAEFDAINLAIVSGSAQRINGTILEIPLAVHIIHNGEPIGTGANISDQQVIDAVQGANERWRLITGNGVDMEVQFCLAQTDPNGNPSNGINRVNGSGIQYYTQYGIAYIGAGLDTGANETTIKNLSNWNHNYVYNIWVVNKIAGGWGGYAFFPLVNNFPTDGTVIVANAMRYTSTTLAHELGHGMGLFHTFNGDFNGCPGNSNCNILGDQVCDTEPHRQEDCASTSCSNKPDSILVNTLKNYMSYCGGRNIFTQGQKDRSRNIIQTTTRKNLVRSVACLRWCDTAFTRIDQTTCNPVLAGVHKDTLSTSKGCDSIVTTTTTLILLPETHLAATTCDPLLAGIHQDTLQSALGCDSIVTTTTTLLAGSETQLSNTTCDPLAAGVRQDTLINSLGCDSIITTTTTLIEPPNAEFIFSAGSGTEIIFENLSTNANTYHWNFGDDSTSLEASPDHTYLSGGSYEVELIAGNDCSSDTARTTVTIITTGLKPSDKTGSILIFPNPGKGNFTIEMDVSQPGTTSLEVVNELGQSVLLQYLGSGKQHAVNEADQLPLGIYQVIIRQNGKTIGAAPLIIAE